MTVGTSYEINAGDTINSIAVAVGVDVGQVCAAVVAAGGRLSPGTRLSFEDNADTVPSPGIGHFIEIGRGEVRRLSGAGTFGIMIVNASETNPVDYSVFSGIRADPATVPAQGGEFTAPAPYADPVYLANLNPPSVPATIRAATVDENTPGIPLPRP